MMIPTTRLQLLLGWRTQRVAGVERWFAFPVIYNRRSTIVTAPSACGAGTRCPLVPRPFAHAVRGGFRHVRPNRSSHKKGAQQKPKLPDSCCCNSSVHCSTGPQQNVDDDYCACRVKAVGRGYSYIRVRGLPFFLNRGPARSKSSPARCRPRPKLTRCFFLR